MKNVIISAGLLALGVMAARNAQAQEAAAPADSEKPWTLSGTLRGFYDDNYNTQPSGPLKVKSFGIDVSPSISVDFKEDQNELSSAYYYKFHYFFARPGHQADQDHRFELALHHYFNPEDVLDLQETFVDSQDPAILNGPVNSAPLRANGDNYHNTFGVDFHEQVTTLFGFVIAYNNNWYHYTGNNQGTAIGQPSYGALLNRFEHGITLDSRWVLSPQSTFIAGYQFGLTQHTSGGTIQVNTAPYLAASTRNFLTHSGYVGLDHEFTENFNGKIRVGVQASDFYNSSEIPANSDLAGTPNSFSPFVDMSLVYKYSEDGSASLGFTDSQNTTDVQSTYNQISETVYGSITHKLSMLSPNLSAILTGSFQNSDYNGGQSSNGNDKDYAVGLNLSYAFTKYLSTEIGYNYNKLTSSQPGRNYSRDYVYIGATASY